MVDQSSLDALAVARDRLIVAARSLGCDVIFDQHLPGDLDDQVGPAIELSDDLVALWTVANPRDVRVPFSPDDLELFPAQQVAQRQDGYTGPDWNAPWVLIGDVTGDPVIADTASPHTHR